MKICILGIAGIVYILAVMFASFVISLLVFGIDCDPFYSLGVAIIIYMVTMPILLIYAIGG